jgi:hypothetical protein
MKKTEQATQDSNKAPEQLLFAFMLPQKKRSVKQAGTASK